MKIAMIHWGFPPIIGGVETHLIFLMPQLVKMGHQVSLLTGSVEGFPDRYNYKGVDVHRSIFFDLNAINKRTIPKKDRRIIGVVSDFLDHVKPDVIHVHNMHYFSSFHTKAVEYYARKKKIPLLLTAHNVWKEKICLDLVCKVRWTKIISISEYVKREICAMGFPEDKIDVIHHGIDEKFFYPREVSSRIYKKYPFLKEKKKYIFHPARLLLIKGCDVTVQAFRIVRDECPDAVLLLSGNANIFDWASTLRCDERYIWQLIKHLGLEKDIYINCFSLEKEMPDLYRLTDVVVYPSVYDEPFGVAMLEGMSTAKPVIVTESGGMPEIIKNDINGYVVPRNNHKILAEKIIAVLKNTGLRRQLGRTGRDLIESHYTMKKYAKKLVNSYRDSLSGGTK